MEPEKGTEGTQGFAITDPQTWRWWQWLLSPVVLGAALIAALVLLAFIIGFIIGAVDGALEEAKNL